MRKSLLFIVALFVLLTACGGRAVSSFVEDFNQTARKYDAITLDSDEFGEIEDEDGEKWQTLFSSKEYELDVMYEGNDIKAYFITVESDTKSINKDGNGYNAVLTLADTLGLNIKDLESGMQKSFDEEQYVYEDDNYEVRIFAIDVLRATMMITIEEL